MLFCIYCTLHYDIMYSMGLFALQKKMAEYSQKEKGIKSQKKKSSKQSSNTFFQ